MRFVETAEKQGEKYKDDLVSVLRQNGNWREDGITVLHKELAKFEAKAKRFDLTPLLAVEFCHLVETGEWYFRSNTNTFRKEAFIYRADRIMHIFMGLLYFLCFDKEETRELKKTFCGIKIALQLMRT